MLVAYCYSPFHWFSTDLHCFSCFGGGCKAVVNGLAGLFWPSMLSAMSLFLVSAHFTFYSDFIQSAKNY